MVVTKTREGCALLGEDKEWAGKTFPTAKARRTTFPVLVHRIRVADVGEKGDETKKEFLRDIQTANQETMPSLTIDNVFWLARSNAAQKQYSSLVLAVTTPEDAKNIMDNGIILGSEFKDAVLYDSTGRPTQCYNCLGLDGHTSARCTKPPRCGNCAEAHGTREC
ncbi:hypothetical protein BJ546DRAFT_863823, partial [Cryomyces antarcticus]